MANVICKFSVGLRGTLHDSAQLKACEIQTYDTIKGK